MNKFWVDDEVLLARVRALWDEGLSAAQIGLRVNLSAGQITGVATRLDWPKHERPLKHPPGTWARSTAPMVEVAHHMSGEIKELRFDNKRRGAIVGQTLPKPKGPTLPASKPLTFKQNAALGRRPVKPVETTPEPVQDAAQPRRLTCQWPTSNGRPWTFCAAAIERGGSPYCLAHEKIAWAKTPRAGDAA